MLNAAGTANFPLRVDGQKPARTAWTASSTPQSESLEDWPSTVCPYATTSALLVPHAPFRAGLTIPWATARHRVPLECHLIAATGPHLVDGPSPRNQRKRETDGTTW